VPPPDRLVGLARQCLQKLAELGKIHRYLRRLLRPSHHSNADAITNVPNHPTLFFLTQSVAIRVLMTASLVLQIEKLATVHQVAAHWASHNHKQLLSRVPSPTNPGSSYSLHQHLLFFKMEIRVFE
jgi:hypothetical protein